MSESENSVLSELLGSNTELAAEVAEFEGRDEAQAEAEAAEATLLGETSEPVAEEAPAAEPEKAKPSDNVPLPVFLETKSELKETKAELRAMREQLAALQTPKVEEKRDERPAFAPSVRYEDDPAEFLKQKIDYQEQLIGWQERNLANVGQQTEQQRQQTHQAQAYQAFSQAVSQAEASYRASQPDYDGAVDHMRQTRAADAQAFVEASGGVWDANTQAQVMQTITQEFAQLAATALQRGKSPAEVLYKLAQSRGYQPPSKSAETKLATIERGMAASKTVSNLPGSRANGQDNEQGVHWLTTIKRGAGYA